MPLDLTHDGMMLTVTMTVDVTRTDLLESWRVVRTYQK